MRSSVLDVNQLSTSMYMLAQSFELPSLRTRLKQEKVTSAAIFVGLLSIMAFRLFSPYSKDLLESSALYRVSKIMWRYRSV